MSSSTATPGRPYLDARREIITFDTPKGRYQITRAERYRLAVLHGLSEAKARHLAYGVDAGVRGPLCRPPPKSNGFTADELYARFHADGTARRPAPPDTPIFVRRGAGAGTVP